MASNVVRTTVTLPADLLAAADAAVRSGKVRSRNELVSIALRHELEARERAEIDAAFAGMADDPDYRADVELLKEEFAKADWEAFRAAEGMSDAL
jgi:metal-responsive CopG/Arc/MetJ family transcriptional regulator